MKATNISNPFIASTKARGGEGHQETLELEHHSQHHKDDQVSGDRVAKETNGQREGLEKLAHQVNRKEDHVQRYRQGFGDTRRCEPRGYVSTHSMATEALILAVGVYGFRNSGLGISPNMFIRKMYTNMVRTR